ncbi:hypothetical protein R1flu_012604 [Riccia fluitans]|uniref:Fe-S cluster assembly factor HCF101, chloroplastic n=1 Tax=Riccia fluitans TaxID=41844 RepID=A0ABD1ZF74_9MARC
MATAAFTQLGKHSPFFGASVAPTDVHEMGVTQCPVKLFPTGISSCSLLESELRISMKKKKSQNYDDKKLTGRSVRMHFAPQTVCFSSCAVAAVTENSTATSKEEVLKELSKIIDPDFGADIVSCGFVKNLEIDESSGKVSFVLELTTPACPVKDMFLDQSKDRVGSLPWVKEVNVTLSSQPARPLIAENVPKGLQRVSNIVAVSSCKGGVGKSTCAVNLAYSLVGMGARVGIFDADIYGPSLPTMVSPEIRVLQMDAETKAIIPTEYMGVKLVSFGFAGQGSAIMRGPMVSGVITQLLTTSDWGELDYLIIDMPPGTGDIQLTLCQVVPLTAAVIVTTPQKLAFIDVAKGIRMFSKLNVPCIALVENMCYFDGDGKRYYPFGKGSGPEVVQQFGIPHLYELPIRPELSAAGDTGSPEVVVDPQGEVAEIFSNIGVSVVQQCAKLRQQVSTAVSYDHTLKAIRVKVPGTAEEFYLHPATVRRNDRSAQSVDEWTGEQRLKYEDIAEDIEPESIQPMGNYAVAINWPGGFSQIAPYEQLQSLERLVDVPGEDSEERAESQAGKDEDGDQELVSEDKQVESSNAVSILQHARALQGSRTSKC